MRKCNLLILFLFLFTIITAKEVEKDLSDTVVVYKISDDDAVLRMIDSIMQDKFFQNYALHLLDSNFLTQDSIYHLEDSIVSLKLAEIASKTPIDLSYNEHVKSFIDLYINKRKTLSSYVLGVAPIYYPLFEEVLDRYNMPLELKHLAIVESALKPSAKSHAGAKGLWQFMYRTGKMYNLNVTSYVDDRMDPYKSTVAACEYMSDLYKLYQDWNLVLAAYNCGPGNVNKAIRRSGGQKDYWKIRPYLPRETRGYVPAFIAVNYMMNYAEDYGIYPKINKFTNLVVDTVHIKRAMSFTQISEYLNLPKEILKEMNPMYKLDFIPFSEEGNLLALPQEQVGIFLINEKNIYADMRRIEVEDSIEGKKKEELIPEIIVHRVRKGEFLGYIANQYKVSVRDIMAWNDLRSTRLNIGDQLKIYAKNSTSNSTTNQITKTDTKSETVENSSEVLDNKYKIHIVKSGDTLWDIARQYENTSVNELRKLNGNINIKHLKPGMKLKVKEIG